MTPAVFKAVPSNMRSFVLVALIGTFNCLTKLNGNKFAVAPLSNKKRIERSQMFNLQNIRLSLKEFKANTSFSKSISFTVCVLVLHTEAKWCLLPHLWQVLPY